MTKETLHTILVGSLTFITNKEKKKLNRIGKSYKYRGENFYELMALAMELQERRAGNARKEIEKLNKGKT